MSDHKQKSRRRFLTGVAVSVGSAPLLAKLPSILAADTRKTVTVQQVIDLVIQNTTGTPLPRGKTVDTLKAGRPDQTVTGIITTFLATFDVLQKTKQAGANLILTHEPTYYNHLDKVESLAGDPVYEAKHRFIEESGFAIWRLHDYWHLRKPDGIINGLVQRLGLHPLRADDKHFFEIDETTFGNLCGKCKQALGVDNLRVVGNPASICQRVGLFAGWGGAMGDPQIELLSKQGADVVICGETAEWTTCEYARDAVTAGIAKGLIVLGHANSEEPGMADVATWLGPKLPGISVTHIAAGDPFRFI